MSLSTTIAATGPFFKLVGDVVAELKRQDLAKIDLELLGLKRTVLAEGLDELEANVRDAVAQEQAQAEQDLISRGLRNTTVLDCTLRAIDQDAANELHRARREYNRGIEEIALLERQVAARSASFWGKLLR